MVFFQGNLFGPVSDNFGQSFVQSANTTFVRVLFNDRLQRRHGDLQMFACETGFIQVLGKEVALSDLDFFFQGVATDINDFHTVPKGRLDCAQIVARGQKHHLAQIVIQVEVIVVKSVVLFRVQDLEKGGRWIAVMVSSKLVDFVEDEQRIARSGFFQVLQNATWHCANVCLAMSSDFGFVTKSAQAHSNILAAQGFGDASTQRGFSHPRRTVQTKDRCLQISFDFQHRQMLNNPFFHFL